MKAEGIFVLMTLVGLVGTFVAGRKSRNGEFERIKNQASSEKWHHDQLVAQANAAIQEFKVAQVDDRALIQKLREAKQRESSSASVEIGRLNDALSEQNAFQRDVISKLRSDGSTLPSVLRWMDRLQEQADAVIVNQLASPPHPAPKAAEQVKEARAIARQYKQESELLRNKVDLYEAQAPWLAELAEYSVEEIIAGIEEERGILRAYETGDDPVRLFMSPEDYSKLSEAARNQLALDRYWEPSRRRSAWSAGVQYERYVGYLYEKDGFQVEYHGATQGKQDLGIDLICRKGSRTVIVQCKRLSASKGIPVRENVVAQIFGASMFFSMRQGLDSSSVTPVIVTSFELSEEAREFAAVLGVKVKEHEEFKPYPCIKCNISERTGERIYHLPFDQQYDRTVVGNVSGEFYALSVADAVAKKFRRAYRWTGQ